MREFTALIVTEEEHFDKERVQEICSQLIYILKDGEGISFALPEDLPDYFLALLRGFSFCERN